jgi:hypothetical protein
MKLSKTLLQAMTVGLTMGAVSSCTPVKEASDVHLKTCDESCEIDHAKNEVNTIPFNCPLCGMG